MATTHPFHGPLVSGGRVRIVTDAPLRAVSRMQDYGSANFLERIYGACVHSISQIRMADRVSKLTSGTPIEPVLQDVAKGSSESYRGYGIDTFVRSNLLAGCDLLGSRPWDSSSKFD